MCHTKIYLRADRQRLMIFLGCMRMVSDSTYILDQKTRHDTKIDELMTILKELFEREEQKVVIFSQWERMTRLVAQELDKLYIGYEYLHGGVPGDKRGKLLENFRDNPGSRVFLSTDAGDTGLNLQSASYIINLDIPWNPAVLEQRIARVHRLGQKNTVNVINFISACSIEHRILALLGFKKSVFEGVLDMGSDSVFMSEDRFTQFMHTVETVAETPVGEDALDDVAEAEIIEPVAIQGTTPDESLTGEETTQLEIPQYAGTLQEIEPEYAQVTSGVPQPAAEPEPVSATPGLGDLISKGIDFLTQLSESLKPTETVGTGNKQNKEGFVRKDEVTGEKYLKIPLSDDKLVAKLAQGLEAFLEVLRK